MALELETKMLLLDESAARTVAKSYDLPVIGSVGCLIRAKRTGMIPEISPLMDAMIKEARFWLNPVFYSTILKDNDE